MTKPGPPTRKKEIREHFKLTFGAVVGITLLALVLYVVISLGVGNSPPQHISRLFETLDFIIKAGVGAIFGLLGGKKIE